MKAKFVYHGSNTANIQIFEPRKRFTPWENKESINPRVYTSPLPAFAVAHSFPWGSEEGFDMWVENDNKVILEVPKKYKERLNQKIYIYKLSANSFQITTEEETGYTVHSEEKIETIEVQEFNNVPEAMKHFDGNIIYIEN